MISKCPEVMEKYTEQSTCVSPNQKPIIIKEKLILMCDSIWKKQNKTKNTPLQHSFIILIFHPVVIISNE